MAKEFTLQKFARDGATVDGNKGFLLAGAVEVHRPGDQFLAGAGFAEDEDGRIGLNNLFHLLEDRLHRRTAADHVGKMVFAAQLLAQVLILGNEAALFQGVVEENFQFFNVDRFSEVIKSPLFHRLDCRLGRSVSGHEDDMGLRCLLFDPAQNIEAADPRHKEIGDDDGKGRLGEALQGIFAAVGGGNLIARLLQEEGEAIAVAAIVIDDKDLRCWFAGVKGHDVCRSFSKKNCPLPRRSSPIARRSAGTIQDIKYFPI